MINYAPVDRNWSGRIPLIVPCVPTGKKEADANVPCAVCTFPRRAGFPRCWCCSSYLTACGMGVGLREKHQSGKGRGGITGNSLFLWLQLLILKVNLTLLYFPPVCIAVAEASQFRLSVSIQ